MQIYKLDENGNIRVWSMEVDGARYRTISGIENGKMVESGWIEAKGKNIGKKNETSPELQAQLTVDRKYIEQLSTGYYSTIEDARNNKSVVFEAMLAQDYKKLKKPIEFKQFSLSHVYSQPKLDGLRAYITRNGAFSRNHKKWLTIPHILETLKPFFEKFPNAVIDGELYNHAMKNEFEKIVSLTRKQIPTAEDLADSARLVEYHIFDIFDFDRPEMDFGGRIFWVNEEFHSLPMIKIVQTDYITDQFGMDEKFAEYMEQGYEGQMIRIDGPYEMRRSKFLLKRKEFDDAEFKIERIESGQGNWDGAAKRVYIRLENGDIQKSGIDGNYETLKKVLEDADSYVNTDATVRFQGRTADGKLRFPVVKYLWKGKRNV